MAKTLKGIVKSLNLPEDYRVYYSNLIKQSFSKYPSTMIIMEEIDGALVDIFLAVEDDETFMELNPEIVSWICSKECTIGATFQQYKRLR